MVGVECLSNVDGSWYEVDETRTKVTNTDAGPRLRVSFKDYVSDHDELLQLEELDQRIASLSSAIQDSECQRLTPGTDVLALQKFEKIQEQKYFNAKIVSAERVQHGPGDYECQCKFKIEWNVDYSRFPSLADPANRPHDIDHTIETLTWAGEPAPDHPSLRKWKRDLEQKLKTWNKQQAAGRKSTTPQPTTSRGSYTSGGPSGTGKGAAADSGRRRPPAQGADGAKPHTPTSTVTKQVKQGKPDSTSRPAITPTPGTAIGTQGEEVDPETLPSGRPSPAPAAATQAVSGEPGAVAKPATQPPLSTTQAQAEGVPRGITTTPAAAIQGEAGQPGSTPQGQLQAPGTANQGKAGQQASTSQGQLPATTAEKPAQQQQPSGEAHSKGEGQRLKEGGMSHRPSTSGQPTHGVSGGSSRGMSQGRAPGPAMVVELLSSTDDEATARQPPVKAKHQAKVPVGGKRRHSRKGSPQKRPQVPPGTAGVEEEMNRLGRPVKKLRQQEEPGKHAETSGNAEQQGLAVHPAGQPPATAATPPPSASLTPAAIPPAGPLDTALPSPAPSAGGHADGGLLSSKPTQASSQPTTVEAVTGGAAPSQAPVAQDSATPGGLAEAAAAASSTQGEVQDAAMPDVPSPVAISQPESEPAASAAAVPEVTMANAEQPPGTSPGAAAAVAAAPLAHVDGGSAVMPGAELASTTQAQASTREQVPDTTMAEAEPTATTAQQAAPGSAPRENAAASSDLAAAAAAAAGPAAMVDAGAGVPTLGRPAAPAQGETSTAGAAASVAPVSAEMGLAPAGPGQETPGRAQAHAVSGAASQETAGRGVATTTPATEAAAITDMDVALGAGRGADGRASDIPMLDVAPAGVASGAQGGAAGGAAGGDADRAGDSGSSVYAPALEDFPAEPSPISKAPSPMALDPAAAASIQGGLAEVVKVEEVIAEQSASGSAGGAQSVPKQGGELWDEVVPVELTLREVARMALAFNNEDGSRLPLSDRSRERLWTHTVKPRLRNVPRSDQIRLCSLGVLLKSKEAEELHGRLTSNASAGAAAQHTAASPSTAQHASAVAQQAAEPPLKRARVDAGAATATGTTAAAAPAAAAQQTPDLYMMQLCRAGMVVRDGTHLLESFKSQPTDPPPPGFTKSQWELFWAQMHQYQQSNEFLRWHLALAMARPPYPLESFGTEQKKLVLAARAKVQEHSATPLMGQTQPHLPATAQQHAAAGTAQQQAAAHPAQQHQQPTALQAAAQQAALPGHQQQQQRPTAVQAAVQQASHLAQQQQQQQQRPTPLQAGAQQAATQQAAHPAQQQQWPQSSQATVQQAAHLVQQQQQAIAWQATAQQAAAQQAAHPAQQQQRQHTPITTALPQQQPQQGPGLHPSQALSSWPYAASLAQQTVTGPLVTSPYLRTMSQQQAGGVAAQQQQATAQQAAPAAAQPHTQQQQPQRRSPHKQPTPPAAPGTFALAAPRNMARQQQPAGPAGQAVPASTSEPQPMNLTAQARLYAAARPAQHAAGARREPGGEGRGLKHKVDSPAMALGFDLIQKMLQKPAS